ncbi:DNA-binding protein [Methylococcus sp. Mc7]|uniref:DNA-binding protein n=1 Tax=Methylococcus sp. Mc7 TaxID=2860258 RepID=UPI0021033A9B|nr:DNA-binding protein [Methylococcus sp. Mc7]
MRDRIKRLIAWSGLTLPELEERTGITAYKWGNLLTGKQRVNEDHITALTKLWPEYAYWITTGKTIPEVGQISPELEETRKKLAKAGGSPNG